MHFSYWFCVVWYKSQSQSIANLIYFYFPKWLPTTNFFSSIRREKHSCEISRTISISLLTRRKKKENNQAPRKWCPYKIDENVNMTLLHLSSESPRCTCISVARSVQKKLKLNWYYNTHITHLTNVSIFLSVKYVRHQMPIIFI